MEKGQASGKGGPFPILTHQPLPWNHFLARPNSSQSNVQIDHTAKYASALQASYFPVCSTHVHMLHSSFFMLSNFCFSFVSTSFSIQYIIILQNKRKTKIMRHKKINFNIHFLIQHAVTKETSATN